MEQVNQEKICSCCKIKKSLDQYLARSDRPNLVRAQCKVCTRRKYMQMRRELSLERRESLKQKEANQARLWRKNNPEWCNERNYGLGKYRYYRSEYEARRRGCAWLLSREEYYALISMPCYYCGKPVEGKGVGLDKIEPAKKEYSMQNSVPCCKRCNWVKGAWFTKEQMIKLGDVIKTF